MGKDKNIKERRKKTEKGPSSSAAAAEFASKRGFGDAFARFKAGGIVSQELVTNETPVLASFDVISDPVLRTYFKHLNKKDPTTRIKALSHIAAHIKESPSEEVIKALPEWIATLKKLVLDNTRRVRELSFIVFQLIIEMVKKELAPYLKSIMGIWLISMHDHDREVARAAQDAFNAAFPTEEKKAKALQFCQNEILQQLISNFQLTVQTLSESKNTPQNEAEERYNRYISSSIDALEYLIRSTKIENELFQQICSNKNFWKFLTIKNFGNIRASTFKLIATVSKVSPELIEPNLETTSPLVLGCFNETDPVVHESMIESLITFMKQFPSAWDYVKPWKSIFPRLWSFLKNPETSSPSKTFQTLLPFVAMLKFEVIGGSNEQSFKFFDLFFTNMWSGYLSDRIPAFEKQIIFNTFTELCMYSLLQARKYIKQEDEQKTQANVNIFMTEIFKNHFAKALKYYLTTEEVPKSEECCKSLCVAIAKFMAREQMIPIIKQFFINDMIPYSISALDNVTLQNVFSDRICSLLHDLKRENNSLMQTDYLLRFAGELFYHCFDNALQHDSNIHLKTAFQFASIIPIDKLLCSSTQVLEPTIFYCQFLVTLFTRYLSVEGNEKSRNFIHSLYGLIGQFFNVFPIHFDQFDIIIDQLVNKPWLLYELVKGIYEAQSDDHKLHNVKLDQIITNYSDECIEIFNNRERSIRHNFMIYIDLIQYLTTKQQVSDPKVFEHILHNVNKFIDTFVKLPLVRKQIFESYVIRLINYLRFALPLQKNHQDPLFLDLLKQIFELRVYDTKQVMYISDIFYDTCIQIGAIEKKQAEETVEENIAYSSKPDQFPFFDSVNTEKFSVQSDTQVAKGLSESSFTQEVLSKDNLEIKEEEGKEEEVEEEEEDVNLVINKLKSKEEYEETISIDEKDLSSQDFNIIDLSMRKENALSQEASETWKSIYYLCITKSNVMQFINESVETLLSILTDPNTLTVSHLQLLMQADTLEEITIDIAQETPSVIWYHLIFNKEIWVKLRNACEDILREVSIGNDIFPIPFTEEQDKSRVVTNIQLYGRFLCFALDKLFVYVKRHHLFLTEDDNKSDISSIKNLWLVTEIIHSSRTQLAVNESTSNTIKYFISENLLPLLLAPNRKMDEHREMKLLYNEHCIDRFIQVCIYLLSLAEVNDSHYNDLKAFIMSTLTVIYDDARQERDIKSRNENIIKALNKLFNEVCSRILFNEELDALLDSNVKTLNFTNIIEAFFSAYLSNETFEFVVSELRTGFNKQWRNQNSGDGSNLYDKAITWISQCASILMQITQDLSNMNFDTVKSGKLMNLLRVQSSLAIFLNHLKDPEENIISMHFAVSVTSEFSNALLASASMDNIMDQVDLIVSRMLFYIYRNTLDGALSLDEQNDEFLVFFVEQHITRCISLLDVRTFSFDEVCRMVQTLHYMIELATSFIQSRGDSMENNRTMRVYSQLLNALSALADFQLLLENNKQYQSLKIFQRVNDRLINDIAISIRNIPGDVFTAIDKSYEGDMKFSLTLLNILETSSSIHALIMAHDLLRSHQDTSYFIVKGELLPQANVPDVMQPEEKYVLLPTLVNLLKKPHPEVKLAPIYEHLKWTNMHSFIDRNEKYNLHYRMLPYFLAWSIVAHLYDQGNDNQKASIFSTLKENQSYITVLNSIVSYLMIGSNTNKYGLNMHELIDRKDLIRTDTTVAISNDANYKSCKSMADLVTHESISLFGAQVFFRLIETFPSLIRVWYINCIGKRAIKHVSAFIKAKVCPIAIEHELEEIINNTRTSMPDRIKVKVIKGRNQVVATYEQDEVQLDITLNIPSDYPLKSLKIESSKRLGVSEMQWRKWTLKMTTVLFSHEGKLWDAIMLWKQNLDRHFEGVEACPICYSIVHIHDHALPKIKCKVCRSKYHGACLYKWFTTSGQSSCPTCRSTSSFL